MCPSCRHCDVARRADPERIYLARRSALFRNLSATGAIDELEAEHLISAWERSSAAAALDRLTQAYWQAAEAWIALERAKR